MAFYKNLIPGYISNNSTTRIRYDIPVMIDDRGANLLGDNCSESLLQSLKVPIRCELSFDSPDVQVSISELFDVRAAFLPKQRK